MPGFSGFASGWQQRGDQNRRSRREIAEAFNRFRQTNPTATLADMQSYIDGMAGGSNYLRGGLPSNEMLGSIAQENQRRAAEERMRQRIEDMARQGQVMGQFSSLADEFILNNDFETGSEGLRAFRESMEIDDGIADRIGLDGLFGDRRIQLVRQQRAMSMVPQIQSLIEDSDATIDLGTLQEYFPDTPRSILQPLLTSARQEQQRVRAERERRLAREEEEYDVRATQIGLEFRRQVSSDPQLVALARRGDRRAFTEQVWSMARNYPDSYFQRVFGVPKSEAGPSLFNDYFDQVINQQRYEAEFALDDFNATQGQQAASSLAAARERSDDIVANLSRDTDNGILAMAARQLQGRYLFTQDLAVATNDAANRYMESLNLRDGDPLPPVSQIIQAIEADPEFQRVAADPRHDPAAQRGPEPVRLEMQSFDDFMQREAQDISDMTEDLTQMIEEADTPEELMAARQAILDWRNVQSRTLRAYADNPRAWIEPGTGGGFTRDALVGGGERSLTGRLAQNLLLLDRRLRMKSESLQPDDPADGVRTEGGAPTRADYTGPIANREVADQVNRVLDAAHRESAGRGVQFALTSLGSFLPGRVGSFAEAAGEGASNEADQRGMIDRARNEVIRSIASIQDPQERARAMASLEADPIAYIDSLTEDDG